MTARVSPLSLTPGAPRFQPLILYKRGRYSVVTLVWEVATQQTRVARLLLQPPGATELDLLQGLDRLARTLGSLPRERLIVFDRLIEGEGGTWMLFEHAAGTPLSHYYGVEATVPDAWIIGWLSRLLEALAALHKQTPALFCGYIEPADVIVRGDGLWLCDLGLFEDLFPEVGAALLGSHPFAHFMAPEKRHSSVQSLAADLYSAGAIAFWLATGHAPMVSSAGGGDRLLAALTVYRPALPAAVSALLVSLLAFYPSQRPAAATEALAALEPYLTDLTGLQPPPAPQVTKQTFAVATRRDLDGEEPWPDVGAPPPIFEAPSVEPTPAVVEFVEDVHWSLRSHPLATGVSTCLGLLAVVLLLQHALRPRLAPLPPLAVVASGTVYEEASPEEARYNGHWVTAHTIRPGARITTTDAGATLSYHGSTLTLQPNTLLTCQGESHNGLSIVLVHGGLSVSTGVADGVETRIPSGNVFLVGGSSQATVDLAATRQPAGYEFLCQKGSATVTVGPDVRALTLGQPLRVSLDGRRSQ